MTRFARHVKRWWRSRGHGVHSPFAFRFITMVLRGRGVYYASAELEAMPEAEWNTLLFKLVCEFEPSEVWADGPLTECEARAIALADSRVRVAEEAEGDRPNRPNKPNGANKARLIRLRSGKGDVTAVRDIARWPELWSEVRGSLSAGMTFSNGRYGIAVSRPDLPRQDFEIL